VKISQFSPTGRYFGITVGAAILTATGVFCLACRDWQKHEVGSIFAWEEGDHYLLWIVDPNNHKVLRAATGRCDLKITDIHGNIFRCAGERVPLFEQQWHNYAIACVFSPVEASREAIMARGARLGETRRWFEENYKPEHWQREFNHLYLLHQAYREYPLYDAQGRAFDLDQNRPKAIELTMEHGVRLCWEAGK